MNGPLLQNKKLAIVLQNKTQLTRQEWDSFRSTKESQCPSRQGLPPSGVGIFPWSLLLYLRLLGYLVEKIFLAYSCRSRHLHNKCSTSSKTMIHSSFPSRNARLLMKAPLTDLSESISRESQTNALGKHIEAARSIVKLSDVICSTRNSLIISWMLVSS